MEYFYNSYAILLLYQTLDHVAIYVLIAGSYSPYLLIGMHSSIGARVLACAVWIVALGGSIFSGMDNIFNHCILIIHLSLV